MDVKNTNKNIFRMIIVMVLIGTLAVANVLFTMVTHRHIWSQEDVLTSKIASSIVDTTVEARRGEILDRAYQVIAQEVKAYTIVAYLDDSVKDAKGNPDYVKDAKSTASKLAAALPDADASSMEKILKNAMDNELIQTELGKGTKRLDKATMEKVENLDLPGIGFIETTNRNYPTTPYSSNMTGFAAYDEDAQQMTGKMGLEMNMNDILAGTNGRVKYQQAVDGTVLPGTTQVYKEARDGDDVVLTIDSNLQTTMEAQLARTMEENNAEAAWALVMEPETGKILAWGSYPTYDQNTHTEIPSYQDNITDRNTEVGSVMKPFTYAAAIDSGVYNGSATYRAGTFTYKQNADGSITRVENKTDEQGNWVPTEFKPISDALGSDFGVLTFDQGLWKSSNVAICELLANYLNYNVYSDYLDKFGFFKPTGIEYVMESSGIENLSTASDYLSTGFGQASSVTWLQLAQAYTAIFNDGKMMKPYVVDSILDPETNEVIQQYEPTVAGEPISAESANHVKEIMKGVINDTGAKFAIEGVDMALKTGTGEYYNEKTGAYDTSVFTSSVVAAAPADDPKIMVIWGMLSANYLNYSAGPFQEIMKAALIANGVSGANVQYQEDDGTGQTWSTYTMPNLTNHSRSFADGQLAGKNVSVIYLGDGSTVTDQYPPADVTINSNSRVLLKTDGANITMPDMTGWTRKDVTAFWSLTGIGVQTSGYGKVTAQNVEPGTPIDGSSDIQVTME